MEEEEEMLSGEDADAAASKLQARMRGKAARQEVADLKASKEATEADAPAGAGGGTYSGRRRCCCRCRRCCCRCWQLNENFELIGSFVSAPSASSLNKQVD